MKEAKKKSKLYEGKAKIVYETDNEDIYIQEFKDDATAGDGAKKGKIKAKGVDTIICMSVNDAFVMHAWGEAQNAENILMLADGNGDLSTALGFTMDGTGFGMGIRSQRFAMIVDDGTVTLLNVEATGAFDVSSAETILSAL